MESWTHVEKLFDEDDGELVAKNVKVKVGDEHIEVPLITLIDPAFLRVNEMDIEFGMSIDVSRSGQAYVHNHHKLLKKSIDTDIKLSIRAADVTEGVALIRDQLNKQLSLQLSGISKDNKGD